MSAIEDAKALWDNMQSAKAAWDTNRRDRNLRMALSATRKSFWSAQEALLPWQQKALADLLDAEKQDQG